MTARKAKKRATKKRSTKKRVRKKPQANGVPIEVTIRDKATRFELEALQLRIDAHRKAVSDPLAQAYQAECNKVLAQKLRDDLAFSKLNEEFQALLNSTAAELSPGKNYAAIDLNVATGVFRYAQKEN